MLEKIGGRKVVFGVFVVAVGLAVDLFGKSGLSENLRSLLEYVFLGFCGGNAVEHLVRLKGGRGAAVPSDEPAPVPSEPALSLEQVLEIQNRLDEIRAEQLNASQELEKVKQVSTITAEKLLETMRFFNVGTPR